MTATTTWLAVILVAALMPVGMAGQQSAPDERLRDRSANPEFDRLGNDRDRTVDRSREGAGGANGGGSPAGAQGVGTGGSAAEDAAATSTAVRRDALETASAPNRAWAWPLAVVLAVAAASGFLYVRLGRR